MFCPKCGTENANDAVYCVSCGAVMGAPAQAVQPAAKTSGLAIASLVLGILGMLGVTALLGIILGIVSLVQISGSRGRLEGSGYAIAGICVSAFMFIFILPAAILFPVFSAARERAKASTCQSHLSRIGLAIICYVNDNNDQLPKRETWCDDLARYEPDRGVFVCPNRPNQPCGYAYNSALSGFSLSSIKYPGNKVETFDGEGGWNSSGGIELADFERHRRGSNISYVDGHVRMMRKLTSDAFDPNATPPPLASRP